MKKKNSRSIKSIFILGLLLVCLVFTVMPSGSARIFELTPHLTIAYNVEATTEIITPIITKLNIELYIDFEVTGPLVALGSIPEYMDATTDAFIDLEVDTASLPDFVSASLSRNQVSADIMQELTRAKEQVILIVSVNEDAPGFIDFVVKVKAKSRPVNGILIGVPAVEAVADVRVQPAYAALISFDEPKGNYMEIGPANTADFPIQITNLGNAPTEVTFEIQNFPPGWSVNIQETITLPSAVQGEEPTETVILRIKPPFGFGYHNDRETVQVKLTPTYLRDPKYAGKTYTLNFTIDNRGFSTPPFETSVIGIIIALIVIVLYYFFFYRRKKK